MSDVRPTTESFFDSAPRQSDYGLNSDGSPFNDLVESAHEGIKETPVIKQFVAGKEYYEETFPKIDKLFDGEATAEEVVSIIDSSLGIAVNYIEAVELVISAAEMGSVEDPMGLLSGAVSTVVAVGMKFVVGYVQPIQDLFGFLTGNPERLKTSASMWKVLAEGVQPIGEDLRKGADRLEEVWKDEGADAANCRVREGRDIIVVATELSLGMAKALEFCASTFKLLQDYMINRASDLAGALISYIPKFLKGGPLAAVEIMADLATMVLRIQVELIRIGLNVVRAFGTLVGLMNAAESAAERMKPYIEAMSGAN